MREAIHVCEGMLWGRLPPSRVSSGVAASGRLDALHRPCIIISLAVITAGNM